MRVGRQRFQPGDDLAGFIALRMIAVTGCRMIKPQIIAPAVRQSHQTAEAVTPSVVKNFTGWVRLDRIVIIVHAVRTDMVPVIEVTGRQSVTVQPAAVFGDRLEPEGTIRSHHHRYCCSERRFGRMKSADAAGTAVELHLRQFDRRGQGNPQFQLFGRFPQDVIFPRVEHQLPAGKMFQFNSAGTDETRHQIVGESTAQFC